MSKLIIDVTYLAHWGGVLTGIPRMINELALRYADLPDTKFVVWSNEGADFYEVDIRGIFKNRGIKIEYLSDNAANNAVADTFSIKVSRRLARYGLPAAGRTHAHLTRRQFSQLRKMHAESGDILFIPMGEWASEAYIDRVVKARGKGVRVAQVIHDMLPLVTPQYSGHSTGIMDNYCRRVLPLTEVVLAVSQNTKRDLAKWLNDNKIEVPPIEVIRHGDNFARIEPKKPADEVFQKANLKGGDFIVCVGTVEVRKNHALLYYVYKLARQRNINLPKIIIVGRKGWRTEDIYDVITHDPDTKGSILFPASINDEELAWLYENCMFSIYPSFYEGWGIPIAESIAHGAPCISSNTSSMTEIAGDLIDYFNPASTDECLDAISKLLQPEELKKARKRIMKYKPTTWDQTFSRVDDVIKGIK